MVLIWMYFDSAIMNKKFVDQHKLIIYIIYKFWKSGSFGFKKVLGGVTQDGQQLPLTFAKTCYIVLYLSKPVWCLSAFMVLMLFSFTSSKHKWKVQKFYNKAGIYGIYKPRKKQLWRK